MPNKLILSHCKRTKTQYTVLGIIALRNDYLKKLYYTASAVKKIQILRGQETEAHYAKAWWAFYLAA
jgi:hypothetical protein